MKKMMATLANVGKNAEEEETAEAFNKKKTVAKKMVAAKKNAAKKTAFVISGKCTTGRNSRTMQVST